jgi:hypothetical protein
LKYPTGKDKIAGPTTTGIFTGKGARERPTPAAQNMLHIKIG